MEENGSRHDTTGRASGCARRSNAFRCLPTSSPHPGVGHGLEGATVGADSFKLKIPSPETDKIRATQRANLP